VDAQRQARLERGRERLGAAYAPKCFLCEVRCGVERAAGKRGPCGLDDVTPVYRRLLHFGEERELVPSYAVWLAGCNFYCSFCSDEAALRPPLPGRAVSAEALAESIARDLLTTPYRVKNVNFVGGDPGVSLPYLADVALALLARVPELPPLLLNTNGYLTPEALEAAVDVFDVFVVDYKFGNDACARAIATPRRYTGVLDRNLERLARSGREVWVRHLLMPEHLSCCTVPVLERLAAWPALKVNVMPAFVGFGESWRSLRREEERRGRELLEGAALSHKYWAGERLVASEP
jgi:putative pyruvate formate lyase activating enzyme